MTTVFWTAMIIMLLLIPCVIYVIIQVEKDKGWYNQVERDVVDNLSAQFSTATDTTFGKVDSKFFMKTSAYMDTGETQIKDAKDLTPGAALRIETIDDKWCRVAVRPLHGLDSYTSVIIPRSQLKIVTSFIDQKRS